jgi:hypothetical protein
MTHLGRLRVSLTKHGAHKISRLLKHLSADQVLHNTSGAVEGVNIDRTMAAVIMSQHPDGSLPLFWASAKASGGDVIDATVMLAISFSHHRLIAALVDGGNGTATGTVSRQAFSTAKEFSNFKNDLIELGFSKSNSAQRVDYDFSPIFRDGRVAPIAAQIFAEKLKTAGWKGNDVVEECIRQKFHSALSLTKAQFREWLSGVALGMLAPPSAFSSDFRDDTISPFVFRYGHAPRREISRTRKFAQFSPVVDLVHNRLQTLLHKRLEEKFGAKCVGTEVASGIGQTNIDVVCHSGGKLTFFELKTAPSARQCIREALPQLLEYAYWPSQERASELVIVSPSAPTADAKKYLKMLREKFRLPIYYQQIDEKTGNLRDKV